MYYGYREVQKRNVDLNSLGLLMLPPSPIRLMKLQLMTKQILDVYRIFVDTQRNYSTLKSKERGKIER